MINITRENAITLLYLLFARPNPGNIGRTALAQAEKMAFDPPEDNDWRREAGYATARNAVKTFQWSEEQVSNASITELIVAIGSQLREEKVSNRTLVEDLAKYLSRTYYQQGKLTGTNLSNLRQALLVPEESADLKKILRDEVRCVDCGEVLRAYEVISFKPEAGVYAPRPRRNPLAGEDPAPEPKVGRLLCSRCAHPLYAKCAERGCEVLHEIGEGQLHQLTGWKCPEHKPEKKRAPGEAEEVPVVPPAPAINPFQQVIDNRFRDMVVNWVNADGERGIFLEQAPDQDPE